MLARSLLLPGPSDLLCVLSTVLALPFCVCAACLHIGILPFLVTFCDRTLMKSNPKQKIQKRKRWTFEERAGRACRCRTIRARRRAVLPRGPPCPPSGPASPPRRAPACKAPLSGRRPTGCPAGEHVDMEGLGGTWLGWHSVGALQCGAPLWGRCLPGCPAAGKEVGGRVGLTERGGA